MDYSLSNQERLLNFFYVIYRRKILILGASLATWLGIIGGTWLAPQSYKATTKLLIHTNPKQEITIFPDLATPGERNTKIDIAQDLVQILTSNKMGAEIVAEFQLDKQYYKREMEPEALRDIVWYYIHKAIDVIKSPYTYSKLFLVYLGIIAPEPPENYFFSALGEFLSDWEDIQPEADTRAINVSIWGPEPTQASRIANRMADLLVKRTFDITRNQAASGYAFTNQQMKDVENKYAQSQEDLKKFKENNRIVSLDDQKKTMVASLDRFESGAAQTKAELKGIREKLSEVKTKLNAEKERINSSVVTGNNPVVTDIRLKLKDLEVQLSSIILQKTKEHPDVIQLQAQINEMNDKLKKEEERIIQSQTEDLNPIFQNLRQQLIDLGSQEYELQGKLSSLETTISEIKKESDYLPKKEKELNRLNTVADINKGVYQSVKDKFEKLLILKANEINEFGLSVISRADLPQNMPVTWPMWDINIIYVGIPLSLLVGFFGGFFVDYWVNPFRSKREVEYNLELPVIGTIPHFNKRVL